MRIRVWGTMALPCMLTEQATVVLAWLYSTDQSGGEKGALNGAFLTRQNGHELGPFMVGRRGSTIGPLFFGPG